MHLTITYLLLRFYFKYFSGKFYINRMLWLLKETAQKVLGKGKRDDDEGERGVVVNSKYYQDYLPEQDKRYSCVHCQAHLAYHNDIISKVSFFCCEPKAKQCVGYQLFDFFSEISLYHHLAVKHIVRYLLSVYHVLC